MSPWGISQVSVSTGACPWVPHVSIQLSHGMVPAPRARAAQECLCREQATEAAAAALSLTAPPGTYTGMRQAGRASVISAAPELRPKNQETECYGKSRMVCARWGVCSESAVCVPTRAPSACVVLGSGHRSSVRTVHTVSTCSMCLRCVHQSAVPGSEQVIRAAHAE